MAYASITLTGTYLHIDGAPAVGTVEIRPTTSPVRDQAGDVVLAGGQRVSLDAAGKFSVDLPATDDPGLDPTGFGYTVTPRLHHENLKAVTFGLPGSLESLDMADVTPADPAADYAPVLEGPSAFDVAVRNGFTGDETEWLASLVGPASTVPGPPGTTSWAGITDKPAIPATADDVGAETPAGAQSKADAAETAANAYTDTGIAGLADTAPAALDTLNELAASLGDDPNFATTVLNQLASKAAAADVDSLEDLTSTGRLSTAQLSATYVARPAGTSAAAANLPFLNVKDFGAKGDNSTNDTTAIQAAIDAAAVFASNTGAVVYFPPGNYQCNGIRMKSKVTLRGASRAATVLKLLNGSNAHLIQLFDARQEQIGLRDLTLIGNKANQVGTWHGVYIQNDSATNGVFASGLNNPHHFIDNLLIRDCSGDGLNMAGDMFGGENHVSNVFAYSCARNGFNITTPDTFFDRLSAGASGEAGFKLNAGNSRFVNCKAWFSGQVTANLGDGFFVSGTTRMQFSNCEAQDNTHHGWYLSTVTHSVFEGCTADSNGTSGTGAGWFLANSANLNRLSVIAYDRQTPTTQTSHMQFDGTCSGNVIDLVGGPGSGLVGTIGENELRYRRSTGGSSKHRIAAAVEFATDNTYDIGITGAKPRDLVLGRNALLGAGLSTALRYISSGVYSATTTDSVIIAATGATGVQMPTPVGVSGRQYKVKNLTGGALPITSVSGNVENVASYSVANLASVTLISDNTNWWVI